MLESMCEAEMSWVTFQLGLGQETGSVQREDDTCHLTNVWRLRRLLDQFPALLQGKGSSEQW